jgi:hypothetical protein
MTPRQQNSPAPTPETNDTPRLVEAISRELLSRYRVCEALSGMAIERHLYRILDEARDAVGDSRALVCSMQGAAPPRPRRRATRKRSRRPIAGAGRRKPAPRPRAGARKRGPAK